jgi:hypothetical protein
MQVEESTELCEMVEYRCEKIFIGIAVAVIGVGQDSIEAQFIHAARKFIFCRLHIAHRQNRKAEITSGKVIIVVSLVSGARKMG